MKIDVAGIVFVPIGTLMVFLVGYTWCRGVRGGRPLTRVQKTMIMYTCLFCIGMGYAIIFQRELAFLLHWKDAWVAITVAWGLVLAAATVWKRRRNGCEGRTQGPPADRGGS